MVTVYTMEFERAHGKKPRGFGHWAFWMGRDTSDINEAHWFTGLYSEAAKQAKAKARELGHTVVTVGS